MLEEQKIELSARDIKEGWIKTTAERADAEVISSRKLVSVVGGIFGGIGIKPDMVNLSRSGFQTRRGKERSKKAGLIKSSFNVDSWFALHWDGKKMGGHRHVDSATELLSIVVTDLQTGESTVLDIPALEHGKADDIMDAILAVLKDWKISSRIVALVFDTTNVNSGANTGVAVQLEKSGSSS